MLTLALDSLAAFSNSVLPSAVITSGTLAASVAVNFCRSSTERNAHWYTAYSDEAAR